MTNAKRVKHIIKEKLHSKTRFTIFDNRKCEGKPITSFNFEEAPVGKIVEVAYYIRNNSDWDLLEGKYACEDKELTFDIPETIPAKTTVKMLATWKPALNRENVLEQPCAFWFKAKKGR